MERVSCIRTIQITAARWMRRHRALLSHKKIGKPRITKAIQRKWITMTMSAANV